MEKRKPGRPRTRPLKDPNNPRPAGRPAKIVDPVRKENNCRRGATHPGHKNWNLFQNGELVGFYHSLGDMAFENRRGYMWAYHVARKCRLDPEWKNTEGYQIFEVK